MDACSVSPANVPGALTVSASDLDQMGRHLADGASVLTCLFSLRQSTDKTWRSVPMQHFHFPGNLTLALQDQEAPYRWANYGHCVDLFAPGELPCCPKFDRQHTTCTTMGAVSSRFQRHDCASCSCRRGHLRSVRQRRHAPCHHHCWHAACHSASHSAAPVCHSSPLLKLCTFRFREVHSAERHGLHLRVRDQHGGAARCRPRRNLPRRYSSHHQDSARNTGRQCQSRAAVAAWRSLASNIY